MTSAVKCYCRKEKVSSRMNSLVKRILCYAYSLTTHTPSAKHPTLNWSLSVRFERVNFADQKNNCTKHLHKAYFVMMMLLLWLLQRIGEMVGSVLLEVLWSGLCRSFSVIFGQVAALSYKMFYVVVAYMNTRNEIEAIGEHEQGTNFGKVADDAEDIENVCEESSISENTCVSLCITGCGGDERRFLSSNKPTLSHTNPSNPPKVIIKKITPACLACLCFTTVYYSKSISPLAIKRKACFQ